MSSAVDVECIVVGAGVVGLAVARALAQQGKEVLIVESAALFGSGISSRNSEVIHAGLYYAPNSLKAKLCIRGKDLIYDFCEQHHVPYQRLGKLLVATNESEIAQLMAIKHNAEQCGVDDLTILQSAEVKTLEPELHCHLALLSPSTGIVDSHGLMLALLGEAENAGAQLVLNTPLKQVMIRGANDFICYFNDSEQTSLSCANLINASGLHATELAKQFIGLDEKHIPQAYYYCKGRYFSYSGKSPFKHLIYPMPNQDGLGVHLTLDLGGQIKFGPDVVWVEDENYDVASDQAESFYQAIRHYWPSLKSGTLQAAYAGIRPKLSGANQAAADFIISTEAQHGISGLVNLFGIESPGLTAAMAIADEVKNNF
ncbi:MAG: NAD(P)/FAD-dependent oxidoreductase [Alcaligenaceae bacterium]|nr:NAD(P)/FAD-dependent oxidoreductase [Alcaligenaceae bacterium]